MAAFPYSTNKTPVNATNATPTIVFTIAAGSSYVFGEIEVDNTNAGGTSGAGYISFDSGATWASVPASACIFYHGIPMSPGQTVLLQALNSTAMSNVNISMH